MTLQPALTNPAELVGVADLELLSRTIVEGFLNGLHRSPHSGSSIEFAQYRPYSQGDDLRFLDWKLYARTDRLHLKQFHEETNLRATILLDVSGSMSYGSEGITKFDYARMLAASLAAMLTQQRDAVGFIAFHETMKTYIPPRGDASHLRRILVELQSLAPEKPTNAGTVLEFLGDVIKPRGMVILISDLLQPAAEVVRQLKSLRARRHDVAVFQISDPAEQEFPFELSQTFVDAEDGEEQFAIPEMVRREYLENRRTHFGEIRRQCHEAEITYDEFTTREPLARALHEWLRHRSRALKTSGMKSSKRTGRGR